MNLSKRIHKNLVFLHLGRIAELKRGFLRESCNAPIQNRHG